MFERHGDVLTGSAFPGAPELDAVQIGEIRKAVTILEKIAFRPGTAGARPTTTNYRLRGVEAAVRDQNARKRRRDLFDGIDVRDAGWEILVELYVMGARGVRLGVSDIGRETDTPQATVVRWLALLEEHHLVSRTADTLDRRRCWVALTKTAEARLEQHFNAIASSEIALCG